MNRATVDSQLGITSPETIALLKEKLKIRVKSASSTIEEDTAIKLKRLLRLEGSAARKKAETVESAVATDGKDDAKSARKRRAEKARLALLQEMEDEDRAAQEKIEQAAREKEERERREARLVERLAQRDPLVPVAAVHRQEHERPARRRAVDPTHEPVADDRDAVRGRDAQPLGVPVDVPRVPLEEPEVLVLAPAPHDELAPLARVAHVGQRVRREGRGIG